MWERRAVLDLPYPSVILSFHDSDFLSFCHLVTTSDESFCHNFLSNTEVQRVETWYTLGR